MIGIGIIGAGNMARLHAAALTRTGRVRIAAFYAPDERARELAEAYHAQTASEPEELFESSSIDAVVIASPTHTHARYLEMAHRARKHVLCEKPLVRTVEELHRIEHLFRDYDRLVMVGHTVRFFPEYAYARDCVLHGTLGDLGVIRLGRCGGFDLPADHWLYNFSCSGGAVLDMMIHDLDFLEWLGGPIESLFAQRASADTLAQDYALVVGRLRSGALFHIEASWAEPPQCFYYFYELAGSKGILDYDSRRNPALTFAPREADCFGHAATQVTPTNVTPYARQAEAFVQALAEGRESPVSLAQGGRAVQLALAVLESAATGQVVRP